MRDYLTNDRTGTRQRHQFKCSTAPTKSLKAERTCRAASSMTGRTPICKEAFCTKRHFSAFSKLSERFQHFQTPLPDLVEIKKKWQKRACNPSDKPLEYLLALRRTLKWSLGSAGEHRLHTAGVTGSNPVATTMKLAGRRFLATFCFLAPKALQDTTRAQRREAMPPQESAAV